MATVADESFGNIRTVKAFSNEDEEIKKFRDGSDAVYKIGKKKSLISAVYSFLVQLCLYGAMATMIYISSLLHRANRISIGSITSFYFYMLMLLMNFSMAAWTFGSFMSIMGASDKIFEIMDTIPLVNTEGGEKMSDC